MSKEEKEKYFGRMRIPTPPPSHPITTKKGEKGYNRKKEKKELYNTLKEEE